MPKFPQPSALSPGKIGNNRRSARYGHSIYENKLMFFPELLHHLGADPTRRASNHNAHDKTTVKGNLYGARPGHQEAAAETRKAFEPCGKDHKALSFAPTRRRLRESL
jgi:hypothetical protein